MEKEIPVYRYITEEYKKHPTLPYIFQPEDAGKRDVQIELFSETKHVFEEDQWAYSHIQAIVESIQAESDEQLSLFYSKMESAQCPPLILYHVAFTIRLNTMLKENLIDSQKLYAFGLRLAKESELLEGVKTGISILGLFENDISGDIIKTLSLHSEFTVFGVSAIATWKKSNQIIFDLAQNTIGYGKLLCVFRLVPFTAEQQQWLLAHGIKNYVAQNALAMECLTKIDMIHFFKACQVSKDTFHDFSYLLAYAGEENDVRVFENTSSLIPSYVELLKQEGNKFIDVAAAAIIRKSMLMLDMSDIESGWNSELSEKIEKNCFDFIFDSNTLLKIKNQAAIITELNSPHESTSLIVKTLSELQFLPHFYELSELLKRDAFDLGLLHFMLVDNAKHYTEDVYSSYNMDAFNEILEGPSIIHEDELSADNKPDFFLVLLLQAMRQIEKYDEELFIHCLNARFQDVRIEALSCLRDMKYKWSDNVVCELKHFTEKEPDSGIRKRAYRLLGAKTNEKEQRYVDITNESVTPSPFDIAITNSTIAGIYYRDVSSIKDLIAPGDTLFLKREPENIYDCNAILVTAEDGYVLGYIPKEQNPPLAQAMDKGESLYAILMDYLSESGKRPTIQIKKNIESESKEHTSNILYFNPNLK